MMHGFLKQEASFVGPYKCSRVGSHAQRQRISTGGQHTQFPAWHCARLDPPRQEFRDAGHSQQQTEGGEVVAVFKIQLERQKTRFDRVRDQEEKPSGENAGCTFAHGDCQYGNRRQCEQREHGGGWR